MSNSLQHTTNPIPISPGALNSAGILGRHTPALLGARSPNSRSNQAGMHIIIVCVLQPSHPSDVIKGHSDRYFVWDRLGLVPSMVIKDKNVEHHRAIIPGGRSLSVLTFCLKSTNGSYHGSVRSSKRRPPRSVCKYTLKRWLRLCRAGM